MESIFHEKQEGYLCAQHCLNALLQGSYFNAVDLANLAHQMDEEERIRMAECGVDSEDYQRFLQQPSGNMDDSGYFSVQVISSALSVWGLELVPYNGTEPIALAAQNDPSRMKAYICNYKGHWYTIRKIGNQWFNLNSVLSGPQLLSDTHLAMYFAQLLQEEYSIFIVMGAFPECMADDIILKNPVSPNSTKSKGSWSSDAVGNPQTSKGYRLGTAEDDELKSLESKKNEPPKGEKIDQLSGPTRKISSKSDAARERIIPIRLQKDKNSLKLDSFEADEGLDQEEANFQQALQLSLSEIQKSEKNWRSRLVGARQNLERPEIPQEQEELDEIQKAMQLSLECAYGQNGRNYKSNYEPNGLNDPNSRQNNASSLLSTLDYSEPNSPDSEDELRRALQLSLECVTAPTTPDPEDLRRRRLAHLHARSAACDTSSTVTKLNT